MGRRRSAQLLPRLAILAAKYAPMLRPPIPLTGPTRAGLVRMMSDEELLMYAARGGNITQKQARRIADLRALAADEMTGHVTNRQWREARKAQA